jgi:hypothetical protein
LPEPNPEIFERLRAVETAWTGHSAECRIRNEHRDQWEKRTDANIDALETKLESLELDRAKLIGYGLGLSAAGASIGSAAVLGLSKLLGG